jgi:F0F1-type ATP synthase membrane subunit c/vacuolar-type H+-ATPase subunit K
MSVASGWAMFCAVLPMTVSGITSAFFQGKSAVNCIYAVGKQESLSGKLIVYPGMIEFYAILGLIISIMLAGAVPTMLV